MKYNELNKDFVLKGISFKINGGERIGCVGRTGAGKSSLIQVLFRMVECTPSSLIAIDGIDIRSIGLHMLRGRIAIIPQTAFIFVGTVKYNLDPIGHYTEEELWEVLKEVRLDKKIRSLKGGMQHQISYSQSVFSVGEKQLLCLARAILRKAKIVVLDEATANVDYETDSFIQKKIKEKFKGCTIFTIAHRLSTIIDYDRIMVMDAGKVVEYDHPYKLLVESIGDEAITAKGAFSTLVKNTGEAASRKLLERSKESWDVRS